MQFDTIFQFMKNVWLYVSIHRKSCQNLLNNDISEIPELLHPVVTENLLSDVKLFKV